MSGSLIIIHADGRENTIPWPRNSRPDYRTIQRCLASPPATEAFFEVIKVRYKGRIRNGYVDEEGNLKGLPLNEVASNMDVFEREIVGPLVIWVPNPKEKMNETSR